MAKTVGQYEVVRKIGEGTFGRTFYATHRLLGTPVCIKQEKTGDAVFRQLFEQEAKLLWGLRHASLPTLKDYYDERDFGQMMVMSFIEGDSLRTMVERDGPVDDEHVCWILQRVLDAMSYLHYHGVIHCDVKPDNIICHTREHNAVLVDFGLYAANPDGTTRAKGGTDNYMPPEFANGLPPIPASDIYSLGKTAVSLLGGRPETGALPPDVPKPLGALVDAMIRHDPRSRPQDARLLAGDIAEVRQRVWGRQSTLEEFKFKRKGAAA
jgi:serine/threonine-protein kinase